MILNLYFVSRKIMQQQILESTAYWKFFTSKMKHQLLDRNKKSFFNSNFVSPFLFEFMLIGAWHCEKYIFKTPLTDIQFNIIIHSDMSVKNQFLAILGKMLTVGICFSSSTAKLLWHESLWPLTGWYQVDFKLWHFTRLMVLAKVEFLNFIICL